MQTSGNKFTELLRERFESLGIPESEYLVLSRKELAEASAIVKSTLRGISVSPAEEWSIAEMAPEALFEKLNSIGAKDEKIWLYWAAYGDGFVIKWGLFVSHFDSLWLPSRDDIIAIAITKAWVLEVSHEEIMRLYFLK